MTMLKQSIIETLCMSMSAEKNTRLAGEEKLAYFAKETPDFASSLLNIAVDGNMDLAVAQLAALTLKQYISQVGAAKAEFAGADEILQQLLTGGIGSHESKIRSAMASCISRIAQLDSENLWPALVKQLLANVSGSDIWLIDGSLRVLDEFANEDLPEKAAVQIAPVLLPALYRAFGNSSVLSGSKVLIIQLVQDFMAVLSMDAMDDPLLYTTIIKEWLDKWISIITLFLKHVAATGALTENAELVTASSSILQDLWSNFNELCAPQTNEVLSSTVRLLTEMQVPYFNAFLSAQPKHLGNTDRLPEMLVSLLELVNRLVDTKQARVMWQSSQAMFNEIGYLAVFYLQMPALSVEEWQTDGAAFLEQEDGEATNTSARTAAYDLLRVLCEKFPQTLASAVLDLLCRRPQVATLPNFALAEKLTVQFGEAVCYALHITKSAISGYDYPLVVAQLEQLMQLCNIAGCEYVSCRACLTVLDFVEQYPEQLNAYIEKLVQLLGSSKTVPGRILCAKAIAQVSKPGLAEPSVRLLSNNFASIFTLLHTLFTSDEERVAGLGLGTLNSVVCLDGARASQLLASELPNIVFFLLETHSGSCSIQDTLEELFAALCRSCPDDTMLQMTVETCLGFVSRYSGADAPPSSSTLDVETSTQKESEHEKQVWATGACLNLLSVCVGYTAETLSSVLRTAILDKSHALGVIFSIIKSDTDSVLVQQASCFLSRLLVRFPELLQNTEVALQVLEAVGAVLDLHRDEACCVYVDELLCGGVLSMTAVQFDRVQLLKALVAKLLRCRMPACAQSLLTVLAHLVYDSRDLFFATFSSLAADNVEMLGQLMDLWCTYFLEIQGAFAVRVHTYAFTQLFLHAGGNPMLSQILVKGDLIPSPADPDASNGSGGSRRIITRSRAKLNPPRYSQIPVPAKWVKLLLHELIEQTESEMAPQRDADNSDSESCEWESDGDVASSHLATLTGDGVGDLGLGSIGEKRKQAHPLYSLSVKKHILEFFRLCIESDMHNFSSLIDNYFSPVEQRNLQRLLKLQV